jgi:hypothetical protein
MKHVHAFGEQATGAPVSPRGETLTTAAERFPLPNYIKVNGKLYCVGWIRRLDPKEHDIYPGGSASRAAQQYSWNFDAEPRTVKDDKTIGRRQRNFYINRQDGSFVEWKSHRKVVPVKIEPVGDKHPVTGEYRPARLL